jgi:hypothetical protein
LLRIAQMNMNLHMSLKVKFSDPTHDWKFPIEIIICGPWGKAIEYKTTPNRLTKLTGYRN